MDSSLGDAGWGATMRAASGREESESDWMAMVRKRLGTMQRASYRRWPGRARRPQASPLGGVRQGQAHAHAQAARLGLQQFQRAAVGAGDGLGQRQPQAHATGAGAGVVQAAEGPQGLAAALGRDARPWSATSSTAWRPSWCRVTSTGGAPWFSALPIRLSSRRPSATASACTTRAGSSAPCSRMSVPAPCQARTRSPSQSCSAMDAYR